MKNLLVFCFAMSTFSACKKDCGEVIEPCIEARLEAFRAEDDAITIRSQTVGNETHYWLITEDVFVDGASYLLDESCDTVCTLCCRVSPPPCFDIYENDAWETVWEK